MLAETRFQKRYKLNACVSIVLFYFLLFSKLSHAIGINLEGVNSFAGVPAGTIRDLEIRGDILYVASENGVFEVVGSESHKLEFNTFNSATGIISDIHLVGSDLWIVEYGVGIFKVDLKSRVAKPFLFEEEWSKSVWAIKDTATHFYFSVIDDVISVEKRTKSVAKLSAHLNFFNLSSAYSLHATKERIYIAAGKGYVKASEDFSEVELYKFSEHLPLITSGTFIKEIDNKLYIGGPEGLYIVGDKKLFVPLEGINGTYVHDVLKADSGEIWVSDGRLLSLTDDELSKPLFMNPILTSESIRTVTKLANGPSGSLLVASSQLGLISLPETMLATNLLSIDDVVLRNNIHTSSVRGSETLVRTEKGVFKLNESTGELLVDQLSSTNDSLCTSWQETLFTKLINKDYDAVCSSEYSHFIDVDKDAFYFYFDDGKKASYFYVKESKIQDIIQAPRGVLQSTLLSGGELAAFDEYDNVHFQLSKFNWRTITASEGSWFGLQCLIELDDSYLVCTSGAGLKVIDKSSGSVSSSPILGNEKLRFIRGAMMSKNRNLWVASNMGLFLKLHESGEVFKLGTRFGILDTDFEYKSFKQLREKLLLKGDKYSYLVDEAILIDSLQKSANSRSPAVLSSVKWIENSAEHVTYFPESLEFKFDSSFEGATFNFVINGDKWEEETIEFYLDDGGWISHNKPVLNLSLSDLDTGSHKLYIRTTSPSNATQSMTVSFEIAPPFWASSTAFLIYALIVFLFWWLWNVGLITKFMDRFRSTTLYTHLTRYEITDGHSKFEKMLRSKERFINEIMQELRTPIQLINGSLEKVSDTAKGASKELICVQDNMKRVEHLINQMSQDVPTALNAADYYKLYSLENIRFVVLSLEPLAKQKRQNLDVRIKGKKEVSLISDSLEKILVNLVQNAIKFTPELGTIKVAAVQDSKELKITITDDGEGIDEHLHQKVFERFEKGNTDKEGSGVGLAMVKSLVELNQGEINLESQKGIGTKVTVTLPMDDVEFVNSHAEDLSPAHAKTNRKSLLIVDDSRAFRTYLFDLFSKKYRCLVARNGVQALEVMQHYLVDLVITDQMMHEMNGLALTKAIRSNNSYAHIPILMLTAETGTGLEKLALEEKVDYFLSKPASNQEITLRVEHLLALRKANENEDKENDRPVFKYGCLKIPEFNNEKDMAFYLNFIAVLEKNYHDESFNREQAAAELLISARSLNRRMSELFEYNFSEFLSRFRIEKSIPLLLEGNSILDTCLDVGFGTAAYFSTSFKKVMLLPPKKFVEQYNETVA